MTLPQRPATTSPVRKAAAPLGDLLRPRPISPPAVRKEDLDADPVTRCAEVFRYHALRLEYALSPGGHLRAWVKTCLAIGLLILVPTALILPPLNSAAAQAAAFARSLQETVQDIVLTGVYVVIGGVVFLMVREFYRERRAGQEMGAAARDSWRRNRRNL